MSAAIEVGIKVRAPTADPFSTMTTRKTAKSSGPRNGIGALQIDSQMIAAMMKDKESGVADWAWYRAWFNRSESLPSRTPTTLEVAARVAGAGAFAEFDQALRAKQPDTEQALVAIRALNELSSLYRPGSPQLRATRVAALPEKVRKSCVRGWRWLAATQQKNGLWSGGQRGTDIGVTAFALLALSAGGHTDARGPYAGVVRKGLRALVERMDKSSFIGRANGPQSVLQHILATAAILDAYVVGSYPTGWVVASLAVSRTLSLRHPNGGWAYSPRSERADLFHTIWAAYALRLGSIANRVGLEEFAPEVLTLVRRLRDPEFGQVGYSIAGGSPARSPNLDLTTVGVGFPQGPGIAAFPQERSASMTAAGVWAHWLLDAEHRSEKVVYAGFQLFSDVRYGWDSKRGSTDLMYWLFASNAISLSTHDGRSGKRSKKRAQEWYLRGVESLLSNQLASGAWPADGVWHAQGGDVYTASAALLCLLAPAQFSPDFLPSRKLGRSGAYGEIEATLRKAVRSKDPRIAFAAYVVITDHLPAPR